MKATLRMRVLAHDPYRAESRLSSTQSKRCGTAAFEQKVGAMFNWIQAGRIGSLYRQRFPECWRCSRTSTNTSQTMSRREWEFFDHVRSLFPTCSLTNYINYALPGSDARPDGFLIGLQVHQLSPPEAYETTPLPVLVFEYLWGDDSFQTLHEYLLSRMPKPYATHLPQFSDITTIRLNELHQRCKQQRRILRNRRWLQLETALRVVGNCTNNLFLDPSPDDEPVGRFISHLGISDQALQILRHEWRRAQAMLKTLGDVTHWLEQEPQNWPHVFEVWQACAR